MQEDNLPAGSNEPRSLTKEENEAIVEQQSFTAGCEEMERITDDIIVPVFKKIAKSLSVSGIDYEVILMDCESPIDDKLYNVGVRLDFTYQEKPIEIVIVADPSDYTFSLSIDGFTEEDDIIEYGFHEVVPRILQRDLKERFDSHMSNVDYSPKEDENDKVFSTYKAPFRVQYDDNGNVSDVATTKTLREAAHMAGTFAKMFRNENAITIFDAQGAEIC